MRSSWLSFLSAALEHAADSLKSDREVVLAAVSNTGSALEYAAQHLVSDHEIVSISASGVRDCQEWTAADPSPPRVRGVTHYPPKWKDTLKT